jgi:DNA-binding NarL/FixJ family response regulator
VTGPVLGADIGSFDASVRSGRTSDPLPAQRHPQSAAPRKIDAPPRVDVLLVDPDQATRESLRRVLIGVGLAQVTAIGTTAEVAEQLERGLIGDLALVSLTLGLQAPGIVASLRAAGWERIVALSPTADIGPVIDAVGAGVSGVVIGRRANPAARNIPSSIHDLSSREIEVIRLVADGRSNKWIGEQLALSALTVKSHLARIGRKLGTGDRAHMVALAMRAGVIA